MSSSSSSGWSSKKVCVVGAGMAGLAAARELRREGLDVTVLEQSADVGGQWLYDAATDGRDPLGMAGVHSSIYSSLRLNSPREVCGFSDFPFRPTNGGGGDARRYPVHGELLRYIREFCDVFGLMDAVRLDTTVVRVAMAPPRRDGSLRWTVRSKHNGDAETEEVFDAVVVATGQYSQPRLPSIDGMDKWRRRQLHSHSYRVPDSFAGEVVVIVGCNLSGKEVALELLRVAKEVHLSSKSTKEAMTPSMSKMLARYDNLHLQPLVEHLCEDGRVVFDDGSFVVADAVIYGGEGHRRRQPRRAAVRARVPTGARAVALLRGHPGQGDPAAVRRGAGEVGGAGAVRAEDAAVAGGDAARRRGVQPRQGGRRLAEAADARPVLGPGVLRRVRRAPLRLPADGAVEEGADLVVHLRHVRRHRELPRRLPRQRHRPRRPAPARLGFLSSPRAAAAGEGRRP
uniref:Flavin-containing monooxygenase n=1 Tax=Oryza sativa subsp. japonica TaxID=39947 RepID=Q5ZC98_ORYSJ|nr:flavin containing monooxygenase 4-like protein [Oryza sativa Japonica Group]BAD88343.1 flavin containing monooxygenase 4-like protein [Oryza sativa Japonica Group]